jgi:hypothetical protein
MVTSNTTGTQIQKRSVNHPPSPQEPFRNTELGTYRYGKSPGIPLPARITRAFIRSAAYLVILSVQSTPMTIRLSRQFKY